MRKNNSFRHLPFPVGVQARFAPAVKTDGYIFLHCPIWMMQIPAPKISTSLARHSGRGYHHLIPLMAGSFSGVSLWVRSRMLTTTHLRPSQSRGHETMAEFPPALARRCVSLPAISNESPGNAREKCSPLSVSMVTVIIISSKILSIIYSGHPFSVCAFVDDNFFFGHLLSPCVYIVYAS